MDKERLRDYLNIRRLSWPYEGCYHVDSMGGHRFVARIDDELAGLAYAEIIEPGRIARMKMNLKSAYAEYGIGTELLELLMEDLRQAGYEVVRYEVLREHYAVQIYRNLGMQVTAQDEEKLKMEWKKEG